MVLLPLGAFEVDKAVEHQVTEHVTGKRVRLEGVHRFAQGARQHFDAHRLDLGDAVVVHVFPVRFTRFQFFANPFQAGGQHHRRAQIGVATDVRGAAFHAAALGRNTQHVGAVVVAVAAVHRRPGGAGHGAALHQTLVAVHGGRDHRADGARVFQHPGDKVVGQR